MPSILNCKTWKEFSEVENINKKLRSINQKLSKKLSIAQEKLKSYETQRNMDVLDQAIDEQQRWSLLISLGDGHGNTYEEVENVIEETMQESCIVVRSK